MIWRSLRPLIGILLLPACWGLASAFVHVVSSAGCVSLVSLAFLLGLVVFAVCWVTLPHPVRTYVLGHELTHALWGLLFGAIPSKLRVGKHGGSVNLTKSNLLITLAPYFFPFYTFVVILLMLFVRCLRSPLPALPVWVFLLGLTWAFHILFTLDTLAQAQPDIKLYGRVFSWSFIFLVNLFFLLLGAPAAGWIRFTAFFPLLVHELLVPYLWLVRHCF